MGPTSCTEPQCLYKGALYLTVQLYLYSPYGPYVLYRASVSVQGCTVPYSTAIPLLPLWAVRPVQSLSACTRVHFTFTYLSRFPDLSDHSVKWTKCRMCLWTSLLIPCFSPIRASLLNRTTNVPPNSWCGVQGICYILQCAIWRSVCKFDSKL
jgi:hypothetical protein